MTQRVKPAWITSGTPRRWWEAPLPQFLLEYRAVFLPMARLAQSAERKALNLVVVGSSPTVGELQSRGQRFLPSACQDAYYREGVRPKERQDMNMCYLLPVESESRSDRDVRTECVKAAPIVLLPNISNRDKVKCGPRCHLTCWVSSLAGILYFTCRDPVGFTPVCGWLCDRRLPTLPCCLGKCHIRLPQ